MYEYRASIVRVVDGDTVEAIVDLGMRVSSTQLLRLEGINAPEIRGEQREQGLDAKAFLLNLVGECDPYVFIVRTNKDKTGKYGRYICQLLGERNGEQVNLNDALVDAGHAVRVEY